LKDQGISDLQGHWHYIISVRETGVMEWHNSLQRLCYDDDDDDSDDELK